MARADRLIWILSFGTATVLALPLALAADPQGVIQLLEHRRCEGCELHDADLVHADLRDVRLRGAQLQRANLSGAQLDGADLSQANLSSTSLAGASMRAADLRGAVLDGTDLRGADLSGARLDTDSLSRSHWQEAKGIPDKIHSYAELHNAGIHAAVKGQPIIAERWFSSAIQRMPEAAISWVARGLSRMEQGKLQHAAQDLDYASSLYASMGDNNQAEILKRASKLLLEPSPPTKGGNGLGARLVSGTIAAFQALAPLAAKMMIPAPF